jgi:branched-chain amino acid transport system substrate-binding protein
LFLGVTGASLAVLAALAVASASCSLVVGSLNECSVDSDCASKSQSQGAPLRCVNQLCVFNSDTPDSGTPDAGNNRCSVMLGNPDAGSVLYLGALLPKTDATGATDARGQYRQQAIQLAVDSLNNQGGVASRNIAVHVCDDSSDGPTAQTLATQLINEGAVAIITGGSTPTLAASSPATPAGVLIFSGSATSAQIASAGVVAGGGVKLVWSAAPSDNLQGQVLASLILDGGYQNPTSIHRNDSYGQGLYDTVDGLLSESGAFPNGLNGGTFSFSPNATDVSVQVSGAEALNPDVVLLIANPNEADRLLSTWTNPDPHWLFSDASRTVSVINGLDGGVQRLQGSMGTGPSTGGANSQVYRDFSNAYIAAFGQDPATSSFVANTYDVTMLLAASAVWANSNGGSITGETMAQGLTHLSDTYADGGPVTPTSLFYTNFPTVTSALTLGNPVNIEGASGALNFDPNTGIAPGPIDIWVIAPDGGIVTLNTVTP